jgi:RimJ/RimL family protein N-acetyltransferase
MSPVEGRGLPPLGCLAFCYGPAAMTEVETTRLLLRPWQPDDLAELTRLLTDPEVTRYIVVHTPFSPQDVAELSQRTLEQWERNGFGPWAAIEKATGRWVGRIGLDELPDWPGPHKIEVGWELHREFWGRGLATEGGRAGVRHGFETVRLERIISATMATNAASRRVMEKCGLRFQGELAMAGTVVAWYAIDRTDWDAGPGSRLEATGEPRAPDPSGKRNC